MLTEAEIKQFIDADRLSEKKQQAEVGQRYYNAEHDILQYRMFYYNADGMLVEDKARSNSRICHPFFTELVDQLTAFILSFEENPIQAKPVAEELQDHLDRYFDDEFWAEMADVISGTTTKGFDYLYGYKNTDNRMSFQHADGLGVVEVNSRDASDNEDHVIYHYVDYIGVERKCVTRIQVHDKDKIWFYVVGDNKKILLDEEQPVNPRPNIVWQDNKTGAMFGSSLGFIPFWRLDCNKRQYSDLHPIKGLIDDYDLMECGLSNNLQDFDHPVYLVKGFRGDDLDELSQNIRTKKTLGVDSDGGLDVLTIDVPYQARKTKADEDEKNIYRFGMGFNSAQSGDGNITNVVIRSRYTLLQLKAGKLEKRIKRFLKGIIRVVLDEINREHGTAYQYTDVEINFSSVIPTNEQENVQNAKTEAETEQIRINTILNVSTVIGDEETLRAICGVMNLDFDDLQGQLEKLDETQNLYTARQTLEGVVVNDPTAETVIDGIES